MTPLQPHCIRKAAFPVAGLSTRFFPDRKAMANERATELRTIHEREDALAAGLDAFEGVGR